MPHSKSYRLSFIWLGLALVILFLSNLSLGSVNIPFADVFKNLIFGSSGQDTWDYIIRQYRLPKAITAFMVGSGLAISGLLMQTFFRNPLAGPYVLGVSSGASLGVALLILGSSALGGSLWLLSSSYLWMALAAGIGSFFVLLAVLIVARKVKNTMSLLIIGLMFGSITSAVISVLAYFSSAEHLQQYMFWSFGSLGNLSWHELLVFALFYLVGIILVIPTLKSLNSLLLGENYAKSLGINFKQIKLLVLLSTSILTGIITAFAGPIAFIGLATPHITKLAFHTSNHRILVPAVALVGAILMLVCDTIAQLPRSEYTLPINAITSIFGAPVVIWLMLRKKKLS